MLIYKYVVPDRIDILENGNIRFTQVDALNDPFESYPCFTLYAKSFSESVSKHLQFSEPILLKMR